MRRAIALFVLLLFVLAGCDKERYPEDRFPDSPLELTYGYCMVSGDQVLLNHLDIDHYDYGTHLIYLKEHRSLSEILDQAEGELTVYAGGEEIYTVGTQPAQYSYAPVGPFIWTNPTFYADNFIAISWLYIYDVLMGNLEDPREDPRIVKALDKYDQYREGLDCKIKAIWFSSPDHLALTLSLSNRDNENYYYLDPEKMGMGLFHYYTNGLTITNLETEENYTNNVVHVEPDPWDGFDMEWLSLLEGNSSVTITLRYNSFQQAPEGSYSARFMFPGLRSQVERGDLLQGDGRIWLGQTYLYKEVVISHDLF